MNKRIQMKSKKNNFPLDKYASPSVELKLKEVFDTWDIKEEYSMSGVKKDMEKYYNEYGYYIYPLEELFNSWYLGFNNWQEEFLSHMYEKFEKDNVYNISKNQIDKILEIHDQYLDECEFTRKMDRYD